MKNRITRILLFALVVILLSYLFNLYFTHIEGDGKKTPKEALPTDQQYEWIVGPKAENEQRYFFLSNGNYFGTGLVTKNLTGWSSDDGVYAELPDPLEENKIISAYSDSKIIYGLIKRNGNVQVTVNGEKCEFVELSNLSDEVIELYGIEGYSIWYIDLKKLDNQESFIIQVLDVNNKVISELFI